MCDYKKQCGAYDAEKGCDKVTAATVTCFEEPLKANKEPVAASPLQCGVMPDVAPNPEDCKRLGDSEGGLLHCPFCEHEAQLWQYEVNDRYVKGACCGDENCPMNNPGRNFEMPTIREAIALWNKRA